VLTDPPYGIKMDKGFSGKVGFRGKGAPIERIKYTDSWDESRPDKKYFESILKLSSNAIIFGGNFFADLLPVGKHWIVWDKKNTMPTFGDCELAWTNIKRNSVKIITIQYNGLIGKEQERFHPTQKPVQLFINILNLYSSISSLILDPFAGSGTTGVACEDLGRRYILIEKEEKYCEIAARRIEAATKQIKLPFGG